MLKTKINKWWKDLKKDVISHKTVYFTLFLLLSFSFFVRVYRTDQLLGFYFDQGRDAKVIWDFWHNGKLFLIGPTTGIEGIFRGPWYYWLIAPFYLLGQGNPVWPSVFLSFTTVLAIFFAFLIGKKISGTTAGLIAVILSGFSFNLVYSSRWLSNPTPMFLISMLLVYSLFKIIDGSKRWWLSIGILLGLAMQFGSAAEVFYFVAVIIFAFWQKKNLPTKKVGVFFLFTLLLIFLPQIYFDFKHNHVLANAIKQFLVVEDSFKASFWDVVKIRFPFYFDVFFSKLFIGNLIWRSYFAVILVLLTLLSIKTLLKNSYFLLIILLLFSPVIGMLFFQGNQGNVYDYYFTGYYLVFIILVASILGTVAKKKLGLVLASLLIVWFLQDNLPFLKGYLGAGVDGPNHITLGNQLQAVDWVLKDGSKKEFNVDIYVPPVIPHAYEYLFLWQTYSKCGKSLCNLSLDSITPLLYTLYEVDPPHPERLEAWLARQKEIARIENTVRYGGITVEERTRLK